MTPVAVLNRRAELAETQRRALLAATEAGAEMARLDADAGIYDAACRLAGDVPRLQREADDLTREVRRLDALAATACDEARDALAARDEAEAALRSVWGVVAPGAEGFPRVERGDDEVADAATIAAAVERRVAAARSLLAALDALPGATQITDVGPALADDLRALLAAWDAAHVAAIEWTGGLVCAYGACRDPVSDECERHGTHYCAAHGPEHQRCYGCVLVPLSGEP